MPYPQFDFTSQYISQSFFRVLQKGDLTEVLDGTGSLLFDYGKFINVSQTASMSVLSASYAAVADISLYSVFATTASVAISSSFATSASWAPGIVNIDTSSLVRNSQTSSMTVLSASFATSASWAPGILNIDTSSLINNSQTSSMTVLSASYAMTASLGQRVYSNIDAPANPSQGAVWWDTDDTGGDTLTVTSASYATTASFVLGGSTDITTMQLQWMGF